MIAPEGALLLFVDPEDANAGISTFPNGKVEMPEPFGLF